MHQLNTLEDFLNWARDYFISNNCYFGHGAFNAWDDALMIARHVLRLPAYVDVSMLPQKLTLEQQQKLFDLAMQRVAKRIPVAYLTQEGWFAGERYYVNEHVLIPRSPFAEIINKHFQPWLGNMQPKRILDLCTGSGCMAIHAAKQFPGAMVDAVDISNEALEVAKKNIALHHCVDRVQPIRSDLFKALHGQRYDIINSNPPYVNKQDMASLPQEYRYEPVLALAAGEEGLDFAIKILQQAAFHLTDHGFLAVEVGSTRHALEKRFPNVAFNWFKIEFGGEGIFLLTADYLRTLKFD